MKSLWGKMTVAGLAVLPLAASCGDQPVTMEQAQPILLALQQAPDAVAHRGVRRFSASLELAGQIHDLEFTEEVASDGGGCFQILPLEVISSLESPGLFLQLQEIRQRFIFRYRDFRVRDIDLLLDNFMIFLDGAEFVTVAGRQALQISIEPKDKEDERFYTIAFDDEHGLVLSYEEKLGDLVVASMTYESVSFDPGVIDCAEPQFGETPIELSELQGIAGVWWPDALPPGYALQEVSTLVEPSGDRWLKQTYTDGIEPLFFLQSQAHGSQTVVHGPGAAAQNPTSIAGSAPSNGSMMALDGDRVSIYRVGHFAVAQGQLRSRSVIALGQVSEDELLIMIDSAIN